MLKKGDIKYVGRRLFLPQQNLFQNKLLFTKIYVKMVFSYIWTVEGKKSKIVECWMLRHAVIEQIVSTNEESLLHPCNQKILCLPHALGINVFEDQSMSIFS